MDQNLKSPSQRDSFETGYTRPPKQYRGILAVLLALIILLGGISSILSIMNIRLFEQLPSDGIAISFSPGQGSSQNAPQPNIAALDIQGERIPDSYRRFYRLPEGVFITALGENSPCKAAGLQENDIIISLNGKRVTSPDALNELLSDCYAGQNLFVVFCREHAQYSTTVTLPPA